MSDQDQKVFGKYEKPPDQVWTIPNDDERGVYRFVLAAARRARQLQAGARPLISTTSRKSTKIAMEEVREGKVEVQIIPEDQPWPPPMSEADVEALSGSRLLGDNRDPWRSDYDRLRRQAGILPKPRVR